MPYVNAMQFMQLSSSASSVRAQIREDENVPSTIVRSLPSHATGHTVERGWTVRGWIALD
jgi:hypothetical protein